MTTSVFTPQLPAELIPHTVTTSAFNHGQVYHASQEPLPDTMTASSPYTTPGPVKPPVPPVPHPKPKPSPNTARGDMEPEDHLALPRPETLTPSLPHNSLAGGHEPPPLPTTPPPESPKNRCAHLVPSLEPVGCGGDPVQGGVCVDLVGKHEPPPVPTTPPPSPPQGRSTRYIVHHSVACSALGPDTGVTGVDSTAHNDVESADCPAPCRSETLPPSLPPNLLTGGHEPPPVPTTPPPESPKNRRAGTKPSEPVGRGSDSAQEDVCMDLAGEHEPPPVPTTPPPPPPQGRSTHHTVYSIERSALGLGADIASLDSTGKHEPPPAPHTPPPPSPKNRGTSGAANSIMLCALDCDDSVGYVNLAGKHEPPPPPITPPPSPPKNKSMHGAFRGKAQSATEFNADVFAQLMLTGLPKVAFVSGALSLVDTVLPTVSRVSIAV